MSDATPNPQRRPSEVAHACLDAHRGQDWPKLRTLLHPEALIATFTGGGRPTDLEQSLSRLREAHKDFMYQADAERMIEIDEQAVLLHGRVQYQDKYGEVAEVERCWLHVIRDGLVYRSAVYGSEEEARNEYATCGPTLGVT